MSLPLALHMAELRRTERRAFVPFLTAGYPDIPTFERLLERCTPADVLEIGLPFSDPVADGPSIQHASATALAHGMHPDILFDVLAAHRALPPVVLMTYVNPVLAYGVEAFFARGRDSGVQGVLLTDVPPEDGVALRAAAARVGIATVQLVAPTTEPQRIAQIAAATTGYLYAVALAGTTGARAALGAEARATVERVRRVTSLPVVVGFGISKPEHVREVCDFADGAVVGSALVDLVRAHIGARDLESRFEHCIAGLAAAAHAR